MSAINGNASSLSFQKLVDKAKELSKDGLTDQEFTQLKQQAATNDGHSSLNEMMFIRSLKNEANVAKLNGADFDPVSAFKSFEKTSETVKQAVKDGKIDNKELNAIHALTDSSINKEDILQSVKDATPKDQVPMGSLADRIGDSAEKEVGKKHRSPSLAGGRKACAYTVSQILKRIPDIDINKIKSADCDTLHKNLLNNGFSKVAGKNFKEGDIVFFGSSKNYTHVGIVSKVVDGVPYMIANSTPKRQVEGPVNLNTYINKKYAGNFAGIVRHNSVDK